MCSGIVDEGHAADLIACSTPKTSLESAVACASNIVDTQLFCTPLVLGSFSPTIQACTHGPQTAPKRVWTDQAKCTGLQRSSSGSVDLCSLPITQVFAMHG